MKISSPRRLIYFYRISHLIFAVCLPIALYPWLITNLVWLVLLIAAWGGLWVSYQQQKKLFTGWLWFDQYGWSLQERQETAEKYKVVGDILCWSVLIILPLQSMHSGKRRYVLIARDSVSPANSAQLRTWLRVCSNPTA